MTAWLQDVLRIVDARVLLLALWGVTVLSQDSGVKWSPRKRSGAGRFLMQLSVDAERV